MDVKRNPDCEALYALWDQRWYQIYKCDAKITQAALVCITFRKIILLVGRHCCLRRNAIWGSDVKWSYQPQSHSFYPAASSARPFQFELEWKFCEQDSTENYIQNEHQNEDGQRHNVAGVAAAASLWGRGFVVKFLSFGAVDEIRNVITEHTGIYAGFEDVVTDHTVVWEISILISIKTSCNVWSTFLFQLCRAQQHRPYTNVHV